MIIRDCTNDRVVIDAAAKINLFLEVLRRREDGFHEINSAFQAVSLYDRLDFRRTEKPGCQLSIEGSPALPADSTNLVTRAFEAIGRKFDLNHGLTCKLTKNIPLAAGLGGGSADAAATLLACNILFELNLTIGDLARIGAQVGSDVPFFFSNGQALVTGRGEIVEPVELPTDYEVLLMNPGMPVDTAEAYAELRMGLTNSRHPFTLPYCRSFEELVNSLESSGNDFEKTQLKRYPELGQVREILLDCGARLTRLSGSGPTVFGVYQIAPELDEVIRLIRRDWFFCSVRPVRFDSDANHEPEGGDFGDYRNPGHLER